MPQHDLLGQKVRQRRATTSIEKPAQGRQKAMGSRGAHLPQLNSAACLLLGIRRREQDV